MPGIATSSSASKAAKQATSCAARPVALGRGSACSTAQGSASSFEPKSATLPLWWTTMKTLCVQTERERSERIWAHGTQSTGGGAVAAGGHARPTPGRHSRVGGAGTRDALCDRHRAGDEHQQQHSEKRGKPLERRVAAYSRAATHASVPTALLLARGFGRRRAGHARLAASPGPGTRTALQRARARTRLARSVPHLPRTGPPKAPGSEKTGGGAARFG